MMRSQYLQADSVVSTHANLLVIASETQTWHTNYLIIDASQWSATTRKKLSNRFQIFSRFQANAEQN